MSPRGIFTHVRIILDCLGQDMQVLYLGRAPRTKETLPDFLKWRRVTRPPLVFRELTGSQRTPGFWGVTLPHVQLSLVELKLTHSAPDTWHTMSHSKYAKCPALRSLL